MDKETCHCCRSLFQATSSCIRCHHQGHCLRALLDQSQSIEDLDELRWKCLNYEFEVNFLKLWSFLEAAFKLIWNLQHKPSSVKTLLKLLSQSIASIPNLQEFIMSSQDCDELRRNSRMYGHLPSILASSSFKVSPCVQMLSKIILSFSVVKPSANVFFTWFMLQIVTAGNGKSLMFVETGSRPMMT